MQYHFRGNVTDQKKLQLRSITSNIKHKIGISFRSNPIETVSRVVPYYLFSSNAFNNPLITICVSNDIFIISEHLVNILEFLVDRENTHYKQFFFAVNVKTKEDIEVKIFPLIDYEIRYCVSIRDSVFKTKNEKNVGYLLKIVNNMTTSIEIGNYFWDGIDIDLEDSDDQYEECDEYEKSPFTLKFDPEYELIDQYNDLIAMIKEEKLKEDVSTNKKEIFRDTKNNSNSLLEDYLLPKTLNLEIIKKSKIISIRFVNNSTFDKLQNYLLKRFGDGDFFCEVDLETEEELFKYVVKD